LGAGIDGFSVGSIARAFATRYGAEREIDEVISADAVADEQGDWARGYALDQQLSGDKARGDKARSSLGCEPTHVDPEGEIASMT
jgi:hypothetical protein